MIDKNYALKLRIKKYSYVKNTEFFFNKYRFFY